MIIPCSGISDARLKWLGVKASCKTQPKMTAGGPMGKAAAIELAGSGVRTKTIFPGFTRTPMIAAADPDGIAAVERLISMGRGGGATVIAYRTLFLASDESSCFTGAEFVVDGGWTAAP